MSLFFCIFLDPLNKLFILKMPRTLGYRQGFVLQKSGKKTPSYLSPHTGLSQVYRGR